jgi:tetratricopeptide (TPR) repeat protein
LGGGAGVYCFMVGVGTFEAYQPYAPDQLPGAPDLDATPTHFVVRQFFMRNPAEEGALLVALSDLLAAYEMTVTFNGRSFDLPLLRLRYTQNRRFLPLDRDAALLRAERPHLDLLMPARKVWRRRLQSCRLINLEQMILGLHRSEDDVPGHLIPELYQHYVQTGHAEAMRRVFYHNNEDIVTMVALADHLSRAFGETPAPSPTLQGLDWAGLGRAHERAGDFVQAESAYTRALESVRNPADRSDLLRSLADLYKRQGRWAQAAETWQSWITSVPGSDPTPYVELAKYCEWELRDLEQAEMWTAWALHNLQKAHPAARRPGDIRDLEHRLARLQRKRPANSEPTESL